MKGILQFTLPEESGDHLAALRGASYLVAIEDMDEYLRGKLKYEDLPPDVHHALDEAREHLRELKANAEA